MKLNNFMKIVKVSSSLGGLTKKGSEKAPDLIVKEIKNFFLNEDGSSAQFDIENVDVDMQDIEETNRRIALKEGDIFIGGDHSITYPCFSNFAKKFKNPGLIVFDSHPDCVNDFKPPTHEDYLRVLIKEGTLKKENVILVGIRDWDKSEFYFLKDNKIKFFTLKQLFNDVENICDIVMELAREFDGLYLSLDVDVVDPSMAPGTGHLEPGGLTSREFIYFIQRLKLLKNLKRVDLVEVDPDKDINNITVRLAAKIVAELI